MRLIDADALERHGQYVKVKDIDAAPSVACEECVFVPARDLAAICHGCYCGSNFERRQP